jgi:hypothetical protein
MSNIIDLADYRDITPTQDEIRMPEDGFVSKGLALSHELANEEQLIAAHKWFSLAAIRGHHKARGHRLRVSDRLTGEQIAHAQAELQSFVKSCT